MDFFYNPNIHPYQEFQRRLTTLQGFAATVSLLLQVNEGDEMGDS